MKSNLLKPVVVFFTCALLSTSLIAQQPDRSKPPQLPPPAKLNTKPVEKFELSNGLKVYMMEKHDVPLVQLNITVKAGYVNDPENKTGLANAALDMMDEGAAGKSALELADAIDYLGVRLTTGAGLHTSNISLHTPVAKLDDALKIMSDILLKPDFPQKELDRKKKNYLTTLMQWHDQPTAVASIAANQFLFGKQHPYGRPAIGTESSIKSFSPEDLKGFYNKYFKAGNAYVVAVGDIKKDALKAKLEAAFGKWQKGSVQEEKVNPAQDPSARIIYLIDKPGSPQSVITIGKMGAKRQTEDYYAITVMNTILGGSFSSRLNLNLREKHGYTYGASSRFSFRPVPGPFIASSSVQTEVTDSALIEFFREFKGISETVGKDELEGAKNYAALGYPGGFQSVSDIAAQIDEMVQYNLPAGYFNDYIPNILKVSADEVEKAAKKYIAPEQMAIIVVGDKAKIEDGIRKLNLGEIKNFTIDDILGKTPSL